METLVKNMRIIEAIRDYRFWFDTCSKTNANNWEAQAYFASKELDAAIDEYKLQKEVTMKKIRTIGEIEAITRFMYENFITYRIDNEPYDSLDNNTKDAWRYSIQNLLNHLETVNELELGKDGPSLVDGCGY